MKTIQATVKAKELLLGDVISLPFLTGGWNTAIVKRKDEKALTLWRPYGTTSSFEYTGGVICYLGTEIWDISIDDSTDYILLRRGHIE